MWKTLILVSPTPTPRKEQGGPGRGGKWPKIKQLIRKEGGA